MRQFIGIIIAMGMLGIIPGMLPIIGLVIGMDICALMVLSGRLQDGYITELEGIIASSSITGKSLILPAFYS